MFLIDEGIQKGEIFDGPFLSIVALVPSKVSIPPIPELTQTPNL